MEPATPDRSSATNHEINPGTPVAPPAPAAPVSTTHGQPPVAPAFNSGGSWDGAFEAIGNAFQQVKKNPQPLFIIIGVYLLLGVLDLVFSGGNQVTTTGTSVQSQSNSNYGGLGGLIFLLATPIYALAIADRRVISVAEFFTIAPRKYFSILGADIALGGLLIISAIGLFIPWIWFIPWFAFISYVIVDQNVGPSKAFGISKALAKNHKGKVWGVFGATILLSILPVVLFLVPKFGSVLSTLVEGLISVLSTASFAMLYRWLQQQQGVSGAPAGGMFPNQPMPPQPPMPPQSSFPPVPPTPPTA